MSGCPVWIAAGTWGPLRQVAVNPRRPAGALAKAQRQRARRKYLSLVEAFCKYDARNGATPLTEPVAARAPRRRAFL
jgi:hypothetical protein